MYSVHAGLWVGSSGGIFMAGNGVGIVVVVGSDCGGVLPSVEVV